MTFASFIPILLYAPVALYKHGLTGAFQPHEDWGKSRAEISSDVVNVKGEHKNFSFNLFTTITLYR